MPKTTSPKPLTITKATSQARRAVDKLMPGVMATVDSRTAWDLAADKPIMITTVTFPEYHASRRDLAVAMNRFGRTELFPTRLVITRDR